MVFTKLSSSRISFFKFSLLLFVAKQYIAKANPNIKVTEKAKNIACQCCKIYHLKKLQNLRLGDSSHSYPKRKINVLALEEYILAIRLVVLALAIFDQTH